MNDVVFGSLIGAVSGVVAALIGSVLSSWLSYRFQSALLAKQLQAQQDLVAQQNAFQADLLDRELKANAAAERDRQFHADNMERTRRHGGMG